MDISEAETLVNRGYMEVFGRAPDPNGLKLFTNAILNCGMAYSTFINRLKTSKEYANLIANQAVSKQITNASDDFVINNLIKERVNFYPFYVLKSGYGILSENLFKTLKRHRCDIIKAAPGYNLHNSNISLQVTMPPFYIKTPSKVNIGYTMIEASKIPDAWIEKCNMMNKLLVPLESNAEIFKTCGVNIPIYVVPIGIDEQIFNPAIKASPIVPPGYKFLIINNGHERKNNKLVIKAFLDEFKNEILKNKIYLIIRSQARYEAKNTVWVTNYLQDPDLAALIKSCDCMISASSGEAGDIPILEGMAMEKPVVVSKELAHSEYITDNKNGFFIETEKVIPVTSIPGLETATWIQPSYDSLKQKMRYVYENRDIASEVGKNAREYIIKNRTLDVCIEPLMKVLSMD